MQLLLSHRWAVGNLISSLMQSTYNGFIRFTCYEIAFRRNFTCRAAGIKNAFGHSKSIPRWEWTRLLPYLFSAVLLVLLSACPVADWLNLPSMLTLNTGIKDPPALASFSPVCDLSCLSAYQNADSGIWFLRCAVCAIFVLDCAPNWVSYAAFTLYILYIWYSTM